MKKILSLLGPALLAAQAATAQVASPVANFTFGETYAPRIERLLPVGRNLLYAARTLEEGEEMWFTDGTDQGTRMLSDACPGSCGSFPNPIGTLGGNLFWSASAENDGSYIWRSDGLGRGATRFARPQGLQVLFRGRLVFQGCLGELCGLLSSDGTAAGTIKLLDGTPSVRFGSSLLFAFKREGSQMILRVGDGGPGWTVLRSLDAQVSQAELAGDRLFFKLTTQGKQELWTSDGTPGGTRAVKQLGSFSLGGYKAAEGRIYFLANDGITGEELWTSDGTAAGTVRVTDLDGSQSFGSFGRLPVLAAVGQKLVFSIEEDVTGEEELWATSGTLASTVRLPTARRTTPLFPAGNRLVFLAYDEDHGIEPWTTDGTVAGTRRVADLCPGPCTVFTEVFGFRAEGVFADPLGGMVFPGGTTLWRSDGTAAGTVPILDGVGGFFDSFNQLPMFFARAADRVYVSGLGGGHGLQMYVKEGSAPARLISNHAHVWEEFTLNDMAALGDRLLFGICSGDADGLWVTRGTPETTTRLTYFDCLDDPDLGTVTAGPLAFFVSPRDEALWRTDGTPEGTFGLAGPEYLASKPVIHQGKAIVVTEEPAAIWQSDGSDAGTRKVADLPFAHEPIAIKSVGEQLYLCVSKPNGSGASQPFVYGGSAASPIALADACDARTGFLTAGPFIYFRVYGALWRTGGTPETTQPLFPDGPYRWTIPEALAEYRGRLYFLAYVRENVLGLFESDGTPAGTAVIREFPQRTYNELTGEVMVVLAGKLFFTLYDPDFGFEAWESDGTAAGTRVFLDLLPGRSSSRPHTLTVVGERLFFTAHDGVFGAELWESDGTVAGTRMVHDIAPVALSSDPQRLEATTDRLYFTADDGVSGRESWSLPLARSGCRPSATRLCLNGGRYQVEATFKDSPSFSPYRSGQAVPLSGDTGYFWFFSPDNIEVIVKVLDGRGVNGHVWTFYGALTDVEYFLTVTDTETGATRRYFNSKGQLLSVADTSGFGPNGAPFTSIEPRAASSVWQKEERRDPAAKSGLCQPSAARLCVGDGRFGIEVAWKDFAGRTGTATPRTLTSDTGAFWFFDAANIELVVKVLDGRPVNGRHWVFYGALSSVEYTMTVTDTATGEVRVYRNPSGQLASVADTGAF